MKLDWQRIRELLGHYIILKRIGEGAYVRDTAKRKWFVATNDDGTWCTLCPSRVR